MPHSILRSEHGGCTLSNEFEQSADLRPGLFPEETAEEAVARIVAQNPQKHGVTVQEREHRLIEQARRIAAETQAFFDAPDTIIEEAGNAEDHETGEVHRTGDAGMAPVLQGDAVEQETTGVAQEDSSERAAAGAQQDQTDRGHIGSAEASAPESNAAGAPDGVAEGTQSTHIVCDGVDVAAASEHAINFLADQQDKIIAQAIGGEFDAGTKQAFCDHFWPEDPDEDTRCPACGLTFKAWVES